MGPMKFRCTAVCVLMMALVSDLAAAADFTLSGVVRDMEGNAVAEASVWLTQQRNARRTEADDQGIFRFSDVAVGEVELVAWKDGYALGGMQARVAGSDSVTLVLGEPDEIEVRVINHEFQPLPGAHVKSMRVGDRFHVSVEDLVEAGFPAMRSDDEGFLTIAHLPKHSHISCVIQHRDYAQAHVAYLPVGRTQNQDIPVYPGVPLRGRVTGPDGEGVADARLTLFRSDGDTVRKFADELTDREGFYTAIVPRGTYHIAVQHPDYGAPDPKSIHLQTDREENVADVELLPARHLRGRVVDSQGEPMGGVDVAFLRHDAIFAQTLTTADGEFELQVGETEGAVRVFPPEGYMTEAFSDVLVRMEETPRIDVGALEVKPLPAIQGTVANQQGDVVENALITAVEGVAPVWVFTDENGEFEIELSHMPEGGVATFAAEHPLRFQRARFEVDFRNPEPMSIELSQYEPDAQAESYGETQNNLSRLVGEQAPPIVCDDWWNTDPVELEDLRGKVVVLLFWGGFDAIGEGRRRLQEFSALNRLYADVDDVVVLGVHDSSLEAEDVERYIRAYNIDFPVGRDVDTAETFTRYRVTYLPETVLIDRGGRLRYFSAADRIPELVKVLRREPS